MGLASRETQPPRLHMSKEGLQGEANNPECLGFIVAREQVLALPPRSKRSLFDQRVDSCRARRSRFECRRLDKLIHRVKRRSRRARPQPASARDVSSLSGCQ